MTVNRKNLTSPAPRAGFRRGLGRNRTAVELSSCRRSTAPRNFGRPSKTPGTQ